MFDAWTDPVRFGRWFGTESTTVEDVRLDVRVGGDWSARMIVGDGVEIGWHGTYLEVDARDRLVLSPSDRPGDQFERVTVSLRRVGSGTEMTFTQSPDLPDVGGVDGTTWAARADGPVGREARPGAARRVGAAGSR